MNQFQTVREAKEYLVRRIVAQAHQDGVPLSDLERDMLYFSETDWTLPNMMAISQDFDQNYDQDEYESKIGQIVLRIRNQSDGNFDDSWDEAVHRLLDEDHYLLVLITGASRSSSRPVKRTRGDIPKLILASVVVTAIYLPVAFFVYSHIDKCHFQIDPRAHTRGTCRPGDVPCQPRTPRVSLNSSNRSYGSPFTEHFAWQLPNYRSLGTSPRN